MPPLVTTFRERVRVVMDEAAGRSGTSPDIIIFAVDGVPHELAVQCWTSATSIRLDSVFPSTSSTAWLSSMTGRTVDSHGVPGVVFRTAGGSLVNVFEFNGQLNTKRMETVFDDAAAYGFLPTAILGDMSHLRCTWRSSLLAGAQELSGDQFVSAYSSDEDPSPAEIISKLRTSVSYARTLPRDGGRPRLIWCFVDLDLYIHRRGYDDIVFTFMQLLDEIAVELTNDGAVILAHSDHGLSPTREDPAVRRAFDLVTAMFAAEIGGAGRVRWLYPSIGSTADVAAELEQLMPRTVQVVKAESYFSPGSPSFDRVGPIMAIATDERFITDHSYSFDHGSLTPIELAVPFSRW